MTTTRAYYHLEIPKRAAECHQGKELFQPKEKYHSLLLKVDEEDFCRRDFCLKCWEEVMKKALPEETVTSWQGTVPAALEKKDEFLSRDEKALSLLKEKITDETTENRQQAFILALYLARKRHLALRKEITLKDGLQALLYEVAETEEMLCVRKLDLPHLEIENIQKALASALRIPKGQ